jgi:hypothetical protein
MNGPPKQAEKVISGSSRRPISVPPILAVYPEMNWYSAWFGRQARDGRHDPAGIAGQHDDVLGMPGLFLRDSVGDKLQRVRSTGILGDRFVVQVDQAGDRVEGDVFEHRPKTMGGGVDLRFGRFRQANDLGITAALEVEDALVAPAMLVVADQAAGRVGGERGFAGSAQAEEQGHIVLVMWIDICRAVHREHTFERQQVVQDRKNRLLDLTRVRAVADDGQLLLEKTGDEGLAVGVVHPGDRI